MGPYWVIGDHTGLKGPYITKRGQKGPYRAIEGHVRPNRAIRSYTEPYFVKDANR